MQQLHHPDSKALRKGRRSQRHRIYSVTFSCALRTPIFTCPTLGRIVMNEQMQLDASEYTCTYASVVMPDHVHWLFVLRGDAPLSKVVGLLKGRSSFRINQVRCEDQTVWQPGFHDRAIRRCDSLRNTAFYIVNNPVRAQLVHRWQDYELLYIDAAIAAEAAPTNA